MPRSTLFPSLAFPSRSTPHPSTYLGASALPSGAHFSSEGDTSLSGISSSPLRLQAGAPGIAVSVAPPSLGGPGGGQRLRRDCARLASREVPQATVANATPSARPWPRPRPARVRGQGRRVLLLQPAREGEGWMLEEEFGLNK